MNTCCRLLVLCTVLIGAAGVEPLGEPELSPAEMAAVWPAAAWAQGTVHTVDGQRHRGQLSIQGQSVVVRTRSDQTLPFSQVERIELSAVNNRHLNLAERAMRQHDYEQALAVFAELERLAVEAEAELPPLFAVRQAEARKGKEAVQALVQAMADADSAQRFLVAFAYYRDRLQLRGPLDESLTALVERAWSRWAGQMEEAQRQQWVETMRAHRLRLQWSAEAAARLGKARDQFAAQDWAEAVSGYAAAESGHGGVTDVDRLNWAQALIKLERVADARPILQALPAAVRSREGAREALTRAGLIAPALAPQLLAYVLVGGPGDQRFTDIQFTGDAGVRVSGGKAALSLFLPFTAQPVGQVAGNPAAAIPEPEAAFGGHAQNKITTNPHDGKRWQVGFKQAGNGIQQPYLISPHGWKWWDWSATQAQSSALAANTRAVEVALPDTHHFITWVVSPGGNSTLQQDPQDISRPLPVKMDAPFTGGAVLFAGNQVTGDMVWARVWQGRPSALALSRFGHVVIGGVPQQAQDFQVHFAADGGGVTVFSADLKPLAIFRLPHLQIRAMAVEGNHLVVVGEVGEEDFTQVPQVGGLQQQPGGGRDAAVALIRLW